MTAVSRKSALALRLAVASVASVWALEAPGCSGTVINSNNSRTNDGGLDGPSSSNGGSGSSPSRRGSGGGSVGGGTSPGGPLCGNGRLDPGEECDGPNLDGHDCYTVTMGAATYGSLYCTACMFNVSGCSVNGGVGGQAGGPTYPGGMLGRGGYPGAAGAAGTAGTAGMMGADPAAVCYANGGIPDPSNPNVCRTGPQAARLCQSHYVNSRVSAQEPLGFGNCSSGCGCIACPAPFDSCTTNYDCMLIMDCAERMNCSRMVDCYQPATCQSVIDSVGGPRGRAAITMSNVLACMSGSGCTPHCGTIISDG